MSESKNSYVFQIEDVEFLHIYIEPGITKHCKIYVRHTVAKKIISFF